MGSPVLARPPALVVKMGEGAGGREAGDRRGLASRRVPRVLPLPFAPPFWPTENHPRASPSHPIPAGRESHLGCSPDPRRALEIGLRNLRVHGLPLPSARGLASRLRPALAHLSQEPAGGYRRHGLFHRAHRDLPGTVLLFRN